ncbi:MAG TPA: energy transducer TonB [Bacteroidia bacterium]|jgi:protein TonB|nr:energy transducer TonB [Bacteroidia bacterium]
MDRNLILNDSFNALVFEHRHKKYGAYQIRKRYSRSVLIAAFIAVTAFSLAMGSYFINLPKAQAADRPKNDSEHIVLVNVLPDPPKQPDPPKPKHVPTAPPPKGPEIKDPSTPQVVDHPVVTKPINDSVGGTKTGVVGGTGPVIKDPPCINCKDSVTAPPPPDPIVLAPSDPPNFDVTKFFHDNTHYPQRAKDEGIQGTVYLQWIVDTDGNITDVKVAKGKHPWLDAEALRVALLMPKWDPAKDHGKAVRYLFTMPVRFELK